MIIDEINHYDTGHFIGLDLSYFPRDMTYFTVSFVILSIITLVFLIKAENKRIKNKNNKKEEIAKQELQKYQAAAITGFQKLNEEDSELKVIFSDSQNIIDSVNHFLHSHRHDPVYVNFIAGAKNTVTQYTYAKNQLLDSLHQGEEITSESVVFTNYKNASLALFTTYLNILKFGVKSQPLSDRQIIDINEI